MKCPKCELDTLEANPKWDEAFDRHERNTPSFDLVHKRLSKEGIIFAKCTNCDYEQLEA